MTHIDYDELNSVKDPCVEFLSIPRWELAPVKEPLLAADSLPPSAEVTMSCFASSEGFETTIQLTRKLIENGHRVTPHLPARSINSSSHLAELLCGLKESNVTDIFVVAGNTKKQVGPYEGALDILEAVTAAGFTVGIAAYPEGHPYLSVSKAIDLLRSKQQYASYLVTQTCFDHRLVADWLMKCRQQGIYLPAHIGVAGVVQRKELVRMAAWMGVGNSMKFINKQRKLSARLFTQGAYDATSFLDSLLDCVDRNDLGPVRLHLNTFNQVERTYEWWKGYVSSTNLEVRFNLSEQRSPPPAPTAPTAG